MRAKEQAIGDGRTLERGLCEIGWHNQNGECIVHFLLASTIG